MITSRCPDRRSDQSGAVAVIVAICALVLFGTSAMAIDLGNAWARKRQSQTQADLAAVAGGSLLPKGDAANQNAIAAEVADYLNKNSISQDQPTVTAAMLQDGKSANGEISFPTNTQLTVIAPQSRVDFGMAGALGESNVEVSTQATAEKRALVPDVDNVLPMWLPATCVYGPVSGDTSPHTTPSVSPTYIPNPDDNKFDIASLSLGTAAYGTTPGTITVTLTNESNSAITGNGAIAFTFGAPTSWAVADTVYPVTLNIPAKSGPTAGTQTVSITVGGEVTDTVGNWQVWGVENLVSGKVVAGTSVFSDKGAPATFTVTGGGGEVQCDDGERGNFGQLDSPRNGISGSAIGQLQKRYEYNVALGLDHELKQFNVPDYPAITTDPECFSDGNPTGAMIDNLVRAGNNCIYVQAGNDPGGLTNGLLAGVSGGPGGSVPGRLFSRPTSERCVDNGKLAPAKADDGHFNWSNINRDTLSCFLKDGVTLADVAKDGADFDLVDQSITQSPRFFYVPVVYSLDRADKKYVAIKSFAPAFLTDETTTSSATPGNGIVMNGGGTQVFSVQIFGFNQFVIPVDVNNPDVDWFDNGRPVIRLVD